MLKKIHKQNFNCPTNNLDYFVTYLRYIRDYYLINGRYGKGHPDEPAAASITAAIQEYDLTNTCIYKYYQEINHKIVQVMQGTPQEVQEAYSKERAVHWGNFWQLVMLNIEDWLAVHDTI